VIGQDVIGQDVIGRGVIGQVVIEGAAMSDRYFVDFCSPTLAKLKAASLFSCRLNGGEDFDRWLKMHEQHFGRSGLHLFVLRRSRDNALILLYRESQLEKTLSDRAVREFLSRFGYPGGSSGIDAFLRHLKRRIASCTDGGFPHEIGIFLGYPLCDVCGFIEQQGQNYLAQGFWKVYGNEQETCAAFDRFRKCRNIYRDLWMSGKRTLAELTVAG
jgi:hypothetical protein